MSIKHLFETNLYLSPFNSRGFSASPRAPISHGYLQVPFPGKKDSLNLPYLGTSNYAYWFYSIHLASSLQPKLSIVIFPPGLSDVGLFSQ